MESHGDLDQSLKKLFVCRRCGAPDVFQGLLRVEELSVVEESDSLLIFFGIHSSFWHSGQGDFGLSPEDPVVRTGSHEKQQRYR